MQKAPKIHDNTIKYFLSDRKNAISVIAETELDEGEQYMGTIAEMFRNEGKHEGAIIGKQEGLVEGKIESVIKAANSRLGILQPDIVNRIKTIQSLEVLDALFDFSLRAESIDQFTDQVRKITDN